MKSKTIKSVMIAVSLIVFSCDEPETTVTNIVHSDGSVSRKIEMKNHKNNFKISDLQVPFDSTWTIKDTIEIGEKKDTTFIKTAEKQFKNVGEINKSYLSDKGANKEIKRKAIFIKKFKWFNTEYRFSELIDKKMSNGYPIKDFLNQEELNYFYSPGSVNNEKLNGKDSLKYKALVDTIKKKTDDWTGKSLISEWIYDFSRLVKGTAANDLTEASLKKNENEFVKLLKKYDNKFDSLWKAGVILKEMIGIDNAVKFKTEADSAIAIVTKYLTADFKDYSVRIIMPGKVIGTNGFIDKTETLLWPVKSDYFFTEPYEMWAESKTPNKWTWIVTGIFVIFVITGLAIRFLRKKQN
jgi:hypothetical protein